jgi:hypothetical protein
LARYFFHFRNGETLTPDHHGIEFDSADAALSEACKAAIAMWSELLEQRSEPTQCAFEIADESGNALFVLPFAEVLERCGLRGRPAPPASDLHALLLHTHERAVTARTDVQSGLTSVRHSLAEVRNLLDRLDSCTRLAGDGTSTGATQR